MCRVYSWGCIVIALLLCSCQGTTFSSSVPRYPVYFNIDTRQGAFVHFIPTAVTSYVLAKDKGLYYNDQLVQPRLDVHAYGYGGVVVYIDIMGNYNAYDLACPYCAGRGMKRSCAVDGIYAVCPECGEQYDLGSGTAVPRNGIARESMLRIPVTNSGGNLIIRQ